MQHAACSELESNPLQEISRCFDIFTTWNGYTAVLRVKGLHSADAAASATDFVMLEAHNKCPYMMQNVEHKINDFCNGCRRRGKIAQI